MFRNNIKWFHFHIRMATVAVGLWPGKRRPQKPPPPATFYYLESYFAGCLLANRIVTRVPFAGLRWRIVPIPGIANRRQRFKIFRVVLANFILRASLSASFPERVPAARGENGKMNRGKKSRTT